jgi:hypothetical protein
LDTTILAKFSNYNGKKKLFGEKIKKTKTKNTMKKIIAVISLVVISIVSFGQITGIPITKDSSIMIDRIYAGSLSGTVFHTDSLYTTGFTGVRVGAMATYKPASWISFSSWAMVQVDGGSDPWSLQQFYMTIQPTQKLSIAVGSMASIPTEMRPHPVSGSGQFETWSQSQIPGKGLGIKAKYQFTKDFELASGVVLRSTMPEYSARLIYKKFQLSGWYSTLDSTSGIAASLKHGRMFSTFVYKPDQTIADMLVVKISKKYDISLYSDMGYDFQKKELVRGEWGVMKTFDSEWIDGLFGLGWDQKNKGINGYLYVHL